MSEKEWASSQYDAMYATGGAEGIYELPYRYSGYFPLFKEVRRILKSRDIRSVLEVGCGTGALAHLLHDCDRQLAYRGFDFSPLAVDRASTRFGRPELFFVGDARAAESYVGDSDGIVCTEVLEHIDTDIEVVSRWRPGSYCVCSVPNFDADNHVRHFQSGDEIRQRYGSLIDIERIVKVKKPFLGNLSPRMRMRALIWNRYRPGRLLAILGLASFSELGGWFVFSGVRNAKISTVSVDSAYSARTCDALA